MVRRQILALWALKRLGEILDVDALGDVGVQGPGQLEQKKREKIIIFITNMLEKERRRKKNRGSEREGERERERERETKWRE